MENVHNLVKVHSCRVQPALIPRDCVESGALYVGELGVHLAQQNYYSPLPRSCRCRRYVSSQEATEFVSYGWAVWVLQFRRRKGEVVLNDEVDKKILMPVLKNKVPRVDMISRADIERSIIGSEKKSRHYMFNPIKKKFVRINVVPENMSKQDWLDEAAEEVKFERRIRKEFSQYISECHNVTLEARAKLIVNFRDDPWAMYDKKGELCAGPALFPFGPDMRTAGGHV